MQARYANTSSDHTHHSAEPVRITMSEDEAIALLGTLSIHYTEHAHDATANELARTLKRLLTDANIPTPYAHIHSS